MPIKRHDPKPTGVRGIKRDGPERFLVCTTYRDPKTGKDVRREGVATSLEAAVLLKEELRSTPRRRRTSREKWRDDATRWAKEHLPGLEASTRERYMNDLAHINVAFGDHYVDAIEARDVRSWTRRMADDYAAPTINGWLRTMRIAFDDAVDAGTVPTNAARSTKAIRESCTKGRRAVAFSPSQFRAFIEATNDLAHRGEIPPDLGRMIVVLAWTGLRIGELRALRFEDVRNGELFVQRAAWNHIEKTTKTDDPRRVALATPAAEALRTQRQWLREHPGRTSGLVFPSSPRQALAGARRRGEDQPSWLRSRSALNAPLRKVCQAADVPEISPHGLRRTFDKLLRKPQVEGFVRRSMAGWRTEGAQAIYTDVDAEDRAAACASIERLVYEQEETETRH